MARNNKIVARAALTGIIASLRAGHKKIVFTNGCFDLLHLGHVQLFEKAKSLGDVLIVAVNSDSSLRRLKGPKRPLVRQADRCNVLAALESVDFVTVFGEDTPENIIRELKPDVLVKGGDYNINQIVGRQYVRKVVRFPIVKGRSTSALIKKIVESYA